MVLTVFLALDILAIIGLLCLLKRLLTPKQPHSLPPGPKGLPFVGNVLDMPSEREWITFNKWADTYGDICSVTVLGQPIIILNSTRVAVDLLDKRSATYSDRPVCTMGGELVGWKNTLVLLPYGDRFRRYRRLFHNIIGSRAAIKQFLPVEEIETHQFLRRVLAKPEDLQQHIRKTAGAIILRISHGYVVKENNDPFVQLAEKATEQFALSTAPGAFMVDLIPALRHVPTWFPLTGWRVKANIWAATLHQMVEQPYNFVKHQMVAGTAPVSFTSTLLEAKQLTAEEEFDIKWSSASLYSAGSDTTVSVISAFFLAMTLYPEVQVRAQRELDSVLGGDRLPTFEDREDLPYIDAIVKEVLRWHSLIPTGIAHRVMQDDVYEGHFIPKGTLILTNLYRLAHDPQAYPDPMTFKPERFIASEGKVTETDPRTFCWGFGRRICPGMHLADASIFMSCAMTLAVFDISKCIENGQAITPVHGNTTGTISHPLPYRCNVRPRSEKAIQLIQAE
ncbi:cytochrome P450 [Roridomyces roridus]|uniref:Cytochrome P450 n=1 Tax=Roridomyces roridus TaxID=1738132 RepID=A0AAD7C410_9AGAR|nr:cytochrome P450 [Roridomyces roridus]